MREWTYTVYIDEGHGNLLLSLSETSLELFFSTTQKMYMWCFKLRVARISSVCYGRVVNKL